MQKNDNRFAEQKSSTLVGRLRRSGTRMGLALVRAALHEQSGMKCGKLREPPCCRAKPCLAGLGRSSEDGVCRLLFLSCLSDG